VGRARTRASWSPCASSRLAQAHLRPHQRQSTFRSDTAHERPKKGSATYGTTLRIAGGPPALWCSSLPGDGIGRRWGDRLTRGGSGGTRCESGWTCPSCRSCRTNQLPTAATASRSARPHGGIAAWNPIRPPTATATDNVRGKTRARNDAKPNRIQPSEKRIMLTNQAVTGELPDRSAVNTTGVTRASHGWRKLRTTYRQPIRRCL
jgi:hypothetical protein